MSWNEGHGVCSFDAMFVTLSQTTEFIAEALVQRSLLGPLMSVSTVSRLPSAL